MYARLTILLLGLLLCACSSGPQASLAPERWQLSWSDEFEGEKIDETKWVVLNPRRTLRSYGLIKTFEAHVFQNGRNADPATQQRSTPGAEATKDTQNSARRAGRPPNFSQPIRRELVKFPGKSLKTPRNFRKE